MGTRTAVSNVWLRIKSTITHSLDDGWEPSVDLGGWVVFQQLETGIEQNQANRGWKYTGTLSAGEERNFDLSSALYDVGAGFGYDSLGQTTDFEEIVTLIISHESGNGRLEMEPGTIDPANWIPKLQDSTGGALRAGGVMMIHQPAEDALEVSPSNDRMTLTAVGDSVTFSVYLLARSDVEGSSSSSVSSSSSSESVSTAVGKMAHKAGGQITYKTGGFVEYKG